MVMLKVLILLLTFNQHVANLSCKRGEKVSRDGSRCEHCAEAYYQDQETSSKYCKPCTKCDSAQGSEIKERCTRYTNTKCECRENFIPWDRDSSICKCDKGFNRIGGKCRKCEAGFFIPAENAECKKWKECKSGVKISGTAMSDVICNEPNSNTYSTTLPTSNTITILQSLVTQHPRGGAQTQRMDTSTATTAPRVATSTMKAPPTPPIYAGNHIGMALLIFGIVGLLVLTVVTCKLHITDCWQKQKTVQPVDSLCRTPIEESGNGSQTPLKSDNMEP